MRQPHFIVMTCLDRHASTNTEICIKCNDASSWFCFVMGAAHAARMKFFDEWYTSVSEGIDGIML